MPHNVLLDIALMRAARRGVNAAAGLGKYELRQHHRYGNVGFGNPYKQNTGFGGYGGSYNGYGAPGGGYGPYY